MEYGELVERLIAEALRDERRSRPPRRALARKTQRPRPRSPCRRRSPNGCRSTRRAPTSSPAWCSPPSSWRSRSSSLIALDIPAKAERAAGVAIGQRRLHRQRLSDRRPQQHGTRADRRGGQRRTEPRRRRAGAVKAPQALVDVGAIRARLLHSAGSRMRACCAGCPIRWSSTSSNARPAALWQNKGGLALIDGEGVVLDRVPVDKMPDLPLLIGPGANRQSRDLRD